MPQTRSARHLTLLCAGLLLACDEPLSPADVAGGYALRRVAGDPLPAVLYTNDHVTVRVFSETLHLTPKRRGTLTTVRESEPLSGGQPTGPTPGVIEFGFRLVDDRLEVAFDCPPNANCVAPPHLVLHRTPNGLEADYALGARLPLIYERLPSAYAR